MVSVTKDIRKFLQYQITAKARGYYDKSITTIFTEDNPSLDLGELTPYDGLKYAVDLSKNSVRAGEINFDGTILPYVNAQKQSLLTTNYCFGNSGINYDLPIYNREYTNLNIVGSPTIENNILSNANYQNYMYFSRSNLSNDCTIICKFKTRSLSPSRTNYFLHCEYFLNLEQYSNGSLYCYSWSGGDTELYSSLEVNKWYWIKIEVKNGNQKIYSISEDGENYTQLADISDTSMSLSSYNYNLFLGRYYSSVDTGMDTGFIDLNESKIIVGDKTYNLGEYTLQKQYTGYTLEGNASINGSICSGFDSSSKVILNNVNFTNEKDIIVGFTTASDVTTAQKIFEYQDDGISFQIVDGKIQYWTKDNRLWHDYETVEANNSYKLKITITSNTSYTLGFMNVNDSDYNNIDVTDTSLTVGKNLTFYIGTNSDSFYKPFQGTIDIGGIPGAYEVKTESKVGIFYNYEDTGLDVKLNCFSKSNEFVVLSSDESITDHTWLGKVNIPEHKVSW